MPAVQGLVPSLRFLPAILFRHNSLAVLTRFSFHILLFFFLAQISVFAQNDSLVQLPAVEVSAVSLRKAPSGSFTETWNLEKLPASGSNVAEFLQNQSGVFFKNYGPGSLATASVRGASASQTALVWNGFQLQSPMLGQLDWSLLPTVLVDEISFQHGGNGAIWGSGAVGGTVAMENKADFDRKKLFKLQSTVGSFGRWEASGIVHLATKKLASTTRFTHLNSKNDFPYQPAPNLPEQRLTNAKQEQDALMQEFYWRPSGNSLFSWQTWLQKNYREIPPTITQTRSLANQLDKAVHSVLSYQRNQGVSVIRARTAFFRESILFHDPLSGPAVPSHFWSSMSELDLQRPLSHFFSMQVIGNQTFTKAFIKNYNGSASRSQSALFGSLRYRGDKISAQFDGRIELVYGKLVPATPSLGIDYQLVKGVKLGAKTGRNYRLPTLNDRFWQPGGNPDLQPELGWSSEVNAEFHFKKKRSEWRFSAAVFNRNIKNWILWHPTENLPYWSASNLARVWSRGLELRFHGATTLPKLKIQYDAGYDFVRSTNQVAVEKPKMEIGTQLIYIPENQAFANLGIQYQQFGITYHHHLTGKVSTDLGELPAWQSANLTLEFEPSIAKLQSRFFLKIENVWDARYFIVERRPMPGRGFSLGGQFTFTKN